MVGTREHDMWSLWRTICFQLSAISLVLFIFE